MESNAASPAETVEGWYALHQMFAIDRAALRGLRGDQRLPLLQEATDALTQVARTESGWSALFELVGSRGDVMLVHFRPTLEEIGTAQRSLARAALFDALEPVYSFLSVTEAGMYHVAAKLIRETREAGGKVGGPEFTKALAERVAKEREFDHIRGRLYPALPDEMPWACFYPMDKKRLEGQNWYSLPLEQRGKLMQEHGFTGRKYAGRVSQVVTGAIGLDAWEWGVTLFAKDPLDFKKIVQEMRYDEASAKYAEFGDFYVGKRITPEAWVQSL